MEKIDSKVTTRASKSSERLAGSESNEKPIEEIQVEKSPDKAIEDLTKKFDLFNTSISRSISELVTITGGLKKEFNFQKSEAEEQAAFMRSQIEALQDNKPPDDDENSEPKSDSQKSVKSWLLHSPAGNSTPPKEPRRGSLFAHDNSLFDSNASPHQVVYSRQPFTLKEEEKMKKMTIKAYLMNKERYDEAKCLHPEDRQLKMVYTLSKDVIRKLANSERSLETEWLATDNFSPNSLYGYGDKIIISMFGRFFKPTSVANYVFQLRNAIKGILVCELKGWEFGITDYHIAIFPSLSELLFKMQEAHNILYHAKDSVKDDKLYPKMVYGKRYDPGLFRIFTSCFKEWEMNIISTLPGKEETLKQMKTDKEFFKVMQKANNEMAKMSRRRAADDQRMKVPESVDQILPDHDTVAETREDPDYRRTHQRSESTRGTLRLLDYDTDNQNAFLYNREFEEEDTDEVESFLQAQAISNQNVRRPIANSDYNSRRSDAHKEKTYITHAAEKQLACFAWAQTKRCPFGEACTYSHDEGICRAYAEAQLKLFVNSPFVSTQVTEVIKSAYPQGNSAAATKQILSRPAYTANTSNSFHQRVHLLAAEEKTNGHEDSTTLSDSKYLSDT